MVKRDPGGLVFEDGPAAGVTIPAGRAPYFLRVVEGDPRTTGRQWDVLDQLHDVPVPGERVHVYEAVPGTLFDPELFMRKTGTFICPTPGAKGQYRHRPDVDGEQLRTTESWRAWARKSATHVELPDGRRMVDGVTLQPMDA